MLWACDPPPVRRPLPGGLPRGRSPADTAHRDPLGARLCAKVKTVVFRYRVDRRPRTSTTNCGWVDGRSRLFRSGWRRLRPRVFGNRQDVIRTNDETEATSHRPGIGGRGASCWSHLQVWRDCYIIFADNWERMRGGEPVTDFPHSPFDDRLLNLPRDPRRGSLWRNDRSGEFGTQSDQLFVMGDTAPSSHVCDG